ncbi:hypothetical protein KKE92_04885 [Candidatus Micrarchaeota archaeon]|nr:hypothetical protein [Candidatus Micrarchaeota archaeon]
MNQKDNITARLSKKKCTHPDSTRSYKRFDGKLRPLTEKKIQEFRELEGLVKETLKKMTPDPPEDLDRKIMDEIGRIEAAKSDRTRKN